MQIHLSKPGGHREGPFTVEEINRDLAAKKYSDSDYWAWYEGLGSWVPLHSVPGVRAQSASSHVATEIIPQAQGQYGEAQVQAESAAHEQEAAVAVMQEEGRGGGSAEEERWQRDEAAVDTETSASLPEEISTVESDAQHGLAEHDSGNEAISDESAPQTTEPEVAETFAQTGQEQEKEPAAESQQSALPSPSDEDEEMSAAAPEMATSAPGRQPKVASGLPTEALEQVFVFTSGEGPSVRQSGIVSMMMLEMIGENPDDLRQRVPRDVFGKCNVGERIRKEGKVPGSAWRAMAALRPEVVERAKGGEYRTCVRTFSTETDDVVAIFLFYNKAQLNPARGSGSQ